MESQHAPVHHPYNTENNVSIFPKLNELDYEGYERGIRKARNTLFIIGGLMVAADLFALAIQGADVSSGEVLVTFVLDAVILAVFIALGFWTKRKPYVALLTGLILFCAIQILVMFVDPSNIYKGLLIKIIVVVSLVSGIRKAKRLQELQRLMGEQERSV